MKVMHKQTREIVEAIKNEDGTYTVNGKVLSKEDMSANYGKAPEDKPKDDKQDDLLIINGECDMGGDIGKLAEALSHCQGEFTSVKKGTKAFNYNYADIAAVLETSSPITSKYGIAVTQMNISKVVNGMLLSGVRTILMHSSGGYVYSEIFVPTQATKSNTLVQMTGVNITYLRRYGIQSALGLATTDNDGRDN